MKRKIRIATALAFAGLLTAVAPLAASANSPILSGYGAPGAGEQAIIGSTLLNGPPGGAGSGGAGSGGASSSGSAGSQSGSGASRGGVSSASGPLDRSGASGAGGGGSRAGRAVRGKGSAATAPRSTRSVNTVSTGARAYVYPSTLASTSNDSDLSISIDGVLLFSGIIATLGLIGVFTVRLARLQT
jgi:hypothetical protein